MRNILAGIQGTVGVLPYILKDTETEKIKDTIKKVQTQVFRGADLIKNVCKLSEIEYFEDQKKIELVSILHSATEFVSKNNPEKKVDIKFENNLENFYVVANDLLLDIFENILFNAINHNKNEQIEIIIKISELKEEERKLIKIEFIDNGFGISDNIKKNIFQKAFKKSEDQRRIGLGLSLVKEILERYEGKIWIGDKIKGDYQQGSNFMVLIPISE